MRALPNRDGIMTNTVIMEGVRTFMGLPSFILMPFAQEDYYIGRKGNNVDPFGIAVKNARLINGDYVKMHSMIQGAVMDML